MIEKFAKPFIGAAIPSALQAILWQI